MRAMRHSFCYALLLLGNAFFGGCATAPGGEPSFGTASGETAQDGQQGFGFTSFGISTFQDNNGDGLPDAREERPTTQVYSRRDEREQRFQALGQERRLDEVTNGLNNNAGKGMEGVPLLKDIPRLSLSASGRKPTDRPPGDQPEAGVQTPERLMIYQGRMQVEVAQVEEAIARFMKKIGEWGGHLGSRQNAEVTVRVPAARFQDAVAELRGYGRVLNESMQASDVTREHLDVTIRLENAQKSRERLLALLAKAEKVEDMLKIEEQLRRLTEEIERMTGQLRFMNDQVAMSTIAVAFEGATAQTGNRRRAPNMFGWVNQIGVEPLRRGF